MPSLSPPTVRKVSDRQTPPRLRAASRDDIDALDALEAACFQTDRLSRRSFQRLLGADTNWLHVATDERGVLLGYCLLLFRRGTSLARLYSIAVLPAARGRHIAEALLERAEAVAAERGKIFLRLEVNSANASAIQLYEKRGYVQFGIYHDYYEDHADALRLQKRVLPYPDDADHRRVPYYAQTTEFTCGPACLMMAMAAIDAGYLPNRSDELQLWREATTIYMTSGHGGCGPHGLALAAWRRGYRAKIYVSQQGPLFLEGVRRQEKKAVLTQVHADFLRDLDATDVTVSQRNVDIGRLRKALAQGDILLALISTWRFDQKKAPHWVVVTAIDERFVYIHDPDLDLHLGADLDARIRDRRRAFENQYIPIDLPAFMQSMQFGQQRLRAALIVGRRTSGSA
jgi:ribosomal protein S18 acetylase RimI-like enzyme